MNRWGFNTDLSQDQIQFLLWRKLQSTHKKRLEHFCKTGRIVPLMPDRGSLAFHSLSDSVAPSKQETYRLRTPGRFFLDRFLLFFELAAIVSFTLVLVSVLSALRTLNQETAFAYELPLLTPTPIISPVGHPSGHIHQSSPNNTQSDEAKIPPHLRPLVQSNASIPAPTQEPEYGIRIRIPAIDVDAPIFRGDAWEQLKAGVAQLPESADPGENGNMVLSGHNDIYGEVFRYLDRLKPGDEITVYTQQRGYTYVVLGWELVEPTQVDVMDPTLNATITLISCYPYLIDTQRIIVKGRMAG